MLDNVSLVTSFNKRIFETDDQKIFHDVKEKYPEVHIALGLSNISFGIPGRNNFNRVFLAMLVAVGCDGAIIDPTESDMMITICSAQAVMGHDEFCMGYLEKMREEGKA